MAIDIPDDGQSINLAYQTQLQANFQVMYNNSLANGLDDAASRFADGITKLKAARDRAESIVTSTDFAPSVASSKAFAMTDDNQLSHALDAFEQAVHSAGGVVGLGGRVPLSATASPSTTWHSLKTTVAKLIAALNGAGSLIPFAKRLASVLTALETMLDAMCP